MNTCLIVPHRLIVDGYIYPEAYPPLGLALIAGTLKNAGHRVTVIDAIGEAPVQHNIFNHNIKSKKLPENKSLFTLGLSSEQITARIPADTEVIGFSCMFSFNWLAAREMINYISSKFPDVKFIAGGEHVSGSPEQCLRDCPSLSACVIGEGEETVLHLLQAFEKNAGLSSVESIVYQQNGNTIKTARRTRLKNLEEIPFPAWELFPVHNYQNHKRSDESKESETSLPLLATRGCPFICTFCTSPDMWGTRYYMRSPQHVIAEIEYLKTTFNATIIEFFDLTAIIKKDWIIEFCKLLLERNLNIGWRIPAGTRSEAIDAEVAYYLKKSGCYQITYAPESGSPRLLKLIKKKVNLNNMLRSIKDSKEQGMIVYLNMIMGLPDETHLDIWKTTWFLIKCARLGVDNVPLHMFRPYPGSVLFDRVLKENKIQVDNDDYLVDSLFTIVTSFENPGDKWQITYYNNNLSKGWYEFYYRAMLICFYASGYILRTSNIIKSAQNILSDNYKNSFERKLAMGVKNIRMSFAEMCSVLKHSKYQKYFWEVYTPSNIIKEMKCRMETLF
jgi:radical SAM superfamily enzyme YgiQ (UPF0313 family)